MPNVIYKVEEPYDIVKQKQCHQLVLQDKLGVKQLVENFIKTYIQTDIPSEIREGVIGIVGRWGSGKSFFLSLLFCELKNYHSYSVVYMDASNYQSESNIVLSILQSIIKNSNTINPQYSEVVKKSIFETFKNTSSNVIKELVINKVKKYNIDENIVELLGMFGENFGKDIFDEFEKTPEDKLKDRLSSVAKDKPLILIIDNLDRCESDFVLDFLAKIKEIFAINNILFILAYDSNKIKSFLNKKYGDEQDILNDYLRKYIAAEFYLNKASLTDSYKECMTQGVVQHFEYSEDENSNYQKVKTNFGNILETLYKEFPLRLIGQYVNRLRIVLKHIKNCEDITMDYKNFLLINYLLYFKFKSKIAEKEYPIIDIKVIQAINYKFNYLLIKKSQKELEQLQEELEKDLKQILKILELNNV